MNESKEQSIKDEFEKYCENSECKARHTCRNSQTIRLRCRINYLETLLTTKYIKRSEIDRDIKGILALDELLKTPSIVFRDALIKLKSKLEVKQ